MTNCVESAEETPADVARQRALDPLLVEGWLRARSVSRGLPQPVADRGGWRVDSGLPQETQRYLFVRPAEGLREIAESVRAPRIFLKLCDTPDVMRSLLPSRWEISPSNFVMICDGEPLRPARPLATGYRLELTTDGAVSRACVLCASGELAASGYAAEFAGVFVYDRILTAETHRRKGLGAHVMTALASARRSASAPQILAATPAGRALYRTLGWSDCAPYTTAAIPEAADDTVQVCNNTEKVYTRRHQAGTPLVYK